MLAILVLTLGMKQQATHATTLQLKVVVTNPNFETLAVDNRGIAYGTSIRQNDRTASSRLYRSTNEGRTWRRVSDLGSGAHIHYLSVLSNNTLIAQIANLGHDRLYRSADRGRTWRKVFEFPAGYTILSAHSIADDGTCVYVGSFNTLSPSSHRNWVWRSRNDGRTWSAVWRTRSHRSIHFVQTDPYTGNLYVSFGDADKQSAIFRSGDHGLSWHSVCSGNACTSVDIAFDPSGFAVYGQDKLYPPADIVRMDLTTGERTKVGALPGPSYSAFNLRDGAWLVGETNEPVGPIFLPQDTNLHLLGSDDGARSFADIYQRPYPDNGYPRLVVQFEYPNGDFPIQIHSGRGRAYGTIVARLVGRRSGPPVKSPSPPTISGKAFIGQKLSARPGLWFGKRSSFSYRWRRCDGAAGRCANIPAGIKAFYRLRSTDSGHTIRLLVTATNVEGSTSASSAASVKVRVDPCHAHKRSGRCPRGSGSTLRPIRSSLG
jgi:hypothetical protein